MRHKRIGYPAGKPVGIATYGEPLKKGFLEKTKIYFFFRMDSRLIPCGINVLLNTFSKKTGMRATIKRSLFALCFFDTGL